MTNMMYYAVMLSTNKLNGNRFINAALGVLVEMVACATTAVVLERVDRRKAYMIITLVTAVAVFFTPIIEPGRGDSVRHIKVSFHNNSIVSSAFSSFISMQLIESQIYGKM